MIERDKIKEFGPLAATFLFVITLTASITFFRSSFNLMEMGKTFTGSFFLTFGTLKAVNLSEFREAFESYDIIAQKSSAYSTTYPFLELSIGTLYMSLLIIDNFNLEIITNFSALGLMSIGAFGVYTSLKGGKEIPCACLGNIFNLPMTKVTLMEDVLMASMALIMLISLV